MGRFFRATCSVLQSAEPKENTEPIHLIVQADNFVSSAEIDYHDGERYPVLERSEGTPDYLDDITKPLMEPEKAPAGKPADQWTVGSGPSRQWTATECSQWGGRLASVSAIAWLVPAL